MELIKVQCLPGMTIPVERFLNSVCEMWGGNFVFFFPEPSRAPPALCPGLFLAPGGLPADISTIYSIKRSGGRLDGSRSCGDAKVITEEHCGSAD